MTPFTLGMGKVWPWYSAVEHCRRLPTLGREATLRYKALGPVAETPPRSVMTDNRFRGLWAVLRNAATWGAAWAVAGGAIATAISLFNPGPGVGSVLGRLGAAILSGIGWGVRFGIAGAVIGTAFSSVIRFRYRGRRLADINPVRFAIVGAVVGGVGVPLYLQAMNVLFGDGPIAWGLVLDDARWATVFGAAVAAGSIVLARRADAHQPGARPDQLERVDGVDGLDGLPEAEQPASSISQRSRSALT